MKKTISFILTFFFLFTSFSLCGKYDKVEKRFLKEVKNLDKKYQDFYRMVYWISTKKERKVFLKLKTNKERDEFIKDFWKCRDSNPKTPENEFKNAYEKDFIFVQKYFSVKGVKPGWLTDRGRIFLILGKPASISVNPVPAIGHPIEIWTYYGNPSLGLPPKFILYFVDKTNGGGLYELMVKKNTNFNSMLSPVGNDNSSFSANNYTTFYFVNDSQSAHSFNELSEYLTLYGEIFSLPEKLFKCNYLKKYTH